MIRVKLMVCMYYYFTVDSCSSAHEQNQDEANEVRAERMVTTINLLAIVATTMTQSPIPSNESQSSSRSKTKARDTGHYAKDCKATTRAMYFNYFKRRMLLENKEESEILLNEKEYDFLAETDGGEVDQKINVNCIFIAKIQDIHEALSDIKVDNGPSYDTNGLTKICLGVDLEPNEWIKDSGCSKHMTGNRKLFSTYKAYNGGNVVFGSNLRGNIIGK
ncbi:hypothetical protein Tco_0581426, partial [Tanacetum coccineum]